MDTGPCIRTPGTLSVSPKPLNRFLTMASREELQLLREARAGNATSQYALGKRYLFGSKSLPQSLPTALHWLSRAATQGNTDAMLLIGEHIAFDAIQTFPERHKLEPWYRTAFHQGSMAAGFTLARLILASDTANDEKRRGEAIDILESVARHDMPEAQWLLAELAKHSQKSSPIKDHALEWTARAADAGIVDAKMALIAYAWENADYDTFLRHALPIARTIMKNSAQADTNTLDEASVHLLVRCGKLLARKKKHHDDIPAMWEIAAFHKNAEAAFLLGLWYARIDENGRRTPDGAGATSFKKAIRWLAQAGEQGMAKAWYALSQIYQKAEFSQRNMADAQRYLEIAANLGHPKAQFDLGMIAWRNRKEDESCDIQAVYWLQKATSNGDTEAAIALNRIASRAQPASWAVTARQYLSQEAVSSHPFLAARIELAAVFGLSRPEALLLDIHAADKGHCLLVDIREFYRRSKRRLILIQTGHERQTLSRISRLFEKVDCGPKGPEGNYRQRQYRLKTLLPEEMATDNGQEAVSGSTTTPA